MDVELKEGERIDDLQRNGYRIIQNPARFCFGMDAVLLSGFAEVKKGETVLDLGTGTGIIPILLEGRTQGSYFTGLEIQEDMAEMASRSVALNGQQEKIRIVRGDLREASRIFRGASFDVIVSNPPYMAENQGLKNPDSPLAIARHEVSCNLEDIIRESAGLLPDGGRFYLVHRPRRLADIFACLNAYHLEPKRLRMVHPFADRPANMVLIEARRGGGRFLKADPPLIVYQAPGVYHREITEIYGY